MERDANEDLIIDKNNLDIECEKQAHSYYFYAKQSADAIEEQQIAKEQVDVMEAQLDGDIRRFPEKYDIADKLTEKKIMSAIWMDEGYQEAKSKVIECTKTVNILRGILTAFDHKKSSLDNLVKLFLSSYYAETTITDNAKDKISDEKNQMGANEAFNSEE